MTRKTIAQLESQVRSLAESLATSQQRESEWKRRCGEAEGELRAQRDITRVAEREADRLNGYIDRIREERQPKTVVENNVDIAGLDDWAIGRKVRDMLGDGARECLRG